MPPGGSHETMEKFTPLVRIIEELPDGGVSRTSPVRAAACRSGHKSFDPAAGHFSIVVT